MVNPVVFLWIMRVLAQLTGAEGKDRLFFQRKIENIDLHNLPTPTQHLFKICTQPAKFLFQCQPLH